MKLLTASYGHDSWSGVWISLRADQFEEPLLRKALANYGCAERFADKAVSLLRSSGRYDCCVQGAWIRNTHDRFIATMASAGVTVVMDDEYLPLKLLTRDNK